MPRYVYDRPQLPAGVEAAIDALGPAPRLVLLAQLRRAGRAGVAQLSEATGMGAATVRRHLDALEALGVVEADEPADARHGRRTTLTVNAERLRSLYRELGHFLDLE